MKKLTNANYLHDVPVDHVSANEQNRGYIDRFISENYKRLSVKFSDLNSTINSSGFGAMDKLNETILSLYTDSKLIFANWEDAYQYMSSKFTDCSIRIVVKKRNLPETESEDVH